MDNRTNIFVNQSLMTQGNKDILLQLLKRHWALGIWDQIDFDKFYLYSIITHPTAIEGSTVTEIENQFRPFLRFYCRKKYQIT